MLSVISAPCSFAPVVSPVAPAQRAVAPVMETIADLEVLSKKLNPIVGYWNPLGLGIGRDEESDEAYIGYLRHAEIKHGRIAMAAFVGYIVGANGVHFPWSSTLEGLTYADLAAAGSPQAQWDAVPTAAKMQIFGLIFLLEAWSEGSTTLASGGEKHYMRGGKPGYYPPFTLFRDTVHPLPFDLFDPFKLSKNASPEKKEKGLLAEINNGRLAMIGIMGFVSESAVPGSVPGLAGLNIPSYSGECMAPFSASDSSLLFVPEMLKFSLTGLPAFQ